MSLRGRLVALGAVVALGLGGFIVILVRTRTPDCGVVLPAASLTPALRALGDFEQAYDASQPQVLEDAAERAASAQDVDLIGTVPGQPVAVVGTGTAPTVLVVPLRRPVPPSSSSTPAIVGLVSFARDCSGGAYFQSVEDDVGLQPAITEFPPVSSASAAAVLGTSALRLQYTTSPLHPQWAIAAQPSKTIAAR